MIVENFDFDVESGFAWINMQGGSIVQCCLNQPKGTPAEQKIVMSDCGHDWGICADVNNNAFTYWGENRCMRALFDSASQNGIEVVE